MATKTKTETIDIKLYGGMGMTEGSATPPGLWAYVHTFVYGSKLLFEVDGVRLFYGTWAQFSQYLPITGKLTMERAREVFDRLQNNRNRHNYNANAVKYRFLVTPDGQLFVKAAEDKFLRTAVEAGGGEVAIRYLNDTFDLEDDELRKPEWALTHRWLITFQKRTFPASWKKARREFIKEKKASGAWDEAKKKRMAKKLAERTDRKMKVCMQTKTVIDELEQYLKDIENGTATQVQVGRIYEEMTRLSSLNKRCKTLFKKS